MAKRVSSIRFYTEMLLMVYQHFEILFLLREKNEINAAGQGIFTLKNSRSGRIYIRRIHNESLLAEIVPQIQFSAVVIFHCDRDRMPLLGVAINNRRKEK